MIPAIVHVVWTGPQMPVSFQRFLGTWKRFHPKWELMVWDLEMVRQLPKLGKAAASATPPALCSQLARVEILSEVGGIYADADCELLRMINFLRETDLLLIHHGPDFIGDCFAGAKPGHPFFTSLVDEFQADLPRIGKDIVHLGKGLGAGRWTKHWRKHNKPATRLKINKEDFIFDQISNQPVVRHHPTKSWVGKPLSIEG